MAKVRKSRGKILALKDDNGPWVSDAGILKGMARSFYQTMFQTTHISSPRSTEINNQVWVSEDDCKDLLRPITEEEVRSNLFRMDPIKSPGPDGIQPVFYQNYWEDIKLSIIQFCSTCFQTASIPSEINNSYITLIPKTDQPEVMTDFRPRDRPM